MPETAQPSPCPQHMEVLFTPADFSTLRQRDLSRTTCVVFDILRATSSVICALGHGASAVFPVEDIPQALQLRQADPDLLLGGERQGFRIQASQTGGLDFDFGNSPREYTRQRVEGRRIAMTTTNGTRALQSCARARHVLVSAFLNISPTVSYLFKVQPEDLLIICSGTYEETAYEDALAAGALVDRIWERSPRTTGADSALMVQALYRQHQNDLVQGLSRARNGRRLLSIPDLKDDVAFCAQRDLFSFAALLVEQKRIIRADEASHNLDCE